MSTNDENQRDMTSEEIDILIQIAMESSTLFTPDEIRQNPHLVAEVLGLAPPTPVPPTTPSSTTDKSVIEDQGISASVDVIKISPVQPAGESVAVEPIVEADSTIPDVAKPEKQKRCGRPECRKKIGICDLQCKCGLFFCSRHRFAVTSEEQAAKDDRCHYCTFDYHAEARERLEREMNSEGRTNHKGFGYGGGPGGGNMAY
jgi:hypothetical protein